MNTAQERKSRHNCCAHTKAQRQTTVSTNSQHALGGADEARARHNAKVKHQRMEHPPANQDHTGCHIHWHKTAAAPLHTLRPLHPRPPAHTEGATPFPSTTSSAMHPAAPRPPTPAHTHSPRPARLAHNTALRPKTATATPTRQHSNPSARAEQPPLCARSPAQRPTPGAESTAAPASAR